VFRKKCWGRNFSNIFVLQTNGKRAGGSEYGTHPDIQGVAEDPKPGNTSGNDSDSARRARISGFRQD
jgi:hypothetical protein